METTNLRHENVSTIKYKYKNTHALLINSLIWSGLGFVIVGLLSIGYSYLLKNQFNNVLGSQGYLIGSGIALIVFLIITIVINVKWSMNVINSSWSLVIGAWAINVIMLTGMVAPYVTLINDPQLVFITIGASGGIFLIMGLIGYGLMNVRTAFMISKLIWIILGVMFLLQFIFMMTFAFAYSNSFSYYYLLFDMAYLLINVLMVGLTFFTIKNQSDVYQDLDGKQKIKLGLYFGMKLLILFVIMFTYLLRFIASFRSN